MGASPAVAVLTPGTQVQWYVVEAVLGQGGFGVTYAATDGNLARPVALKEYFPESFAARGADGSVHPASAAEEETFRWGRARFLDEARTVARFDHPSIVRVLSVFEQNGTAYMAMERERGVSLSAAIRDGRLSNETSLLRVVAALLSGLEHIHARGFVHRDIKPENILLRENGEPVLLDFGSARRALDVAGRLTAVVTRGYAPFEQYDDTGDDARQGPWTDVYSLGASLYHIVTGAPPPDALIRGAALLEGKPDPLRPAAEVGAGRYSDAFLSAIDAALAFSASERPQSAAQWRAQFPLDQASIKVDTLPPDAPGWESAAPDTIVVRSAETQRLGLDILVVDDEPFVLSLTKRVLARIGIEDASTATSGRAALTLIAERCRGPDVILCDLKMPDMDGLEFLRHLGARRIESAIILVTGVDQRLRDTAENLARVHGLQVLGSAEKPLKPDLLEKLLHSYHTTRRAEQAGPAAGVTEAELREGLAGDAVHVHFQPKVCVETRRLAGVEALARWRHPERGIIGPGAFVALAEETGNMDRLTDIVMRKAFVAGADWMAQGIEVPIAVNVSVDSLTPELPEQVVACAESAGLRPGLVTLEVTESRLMRDVTTAVEALARLRLKGIGLAIDDFGTGYSSLEQLRRIPFTELKIDRAFVHGAGSDPSANAILESSASLGRKLGLRVTAEGVEDQADWDAIAGAGCDVVQGYFAAKPMEADRIPDWANAWESQEA